MGGLGEHPVCLCEFLSLLFLVPSSRAQVAPLDRSPPKSPCERGSSKGLPFGGLDDDLSRLGVLTPPNPKFWGRE